MKQLERLFKKKKKIIVGLMSGTSTDGIDAAIVEIINSGQNTSMNQIAFKTYSYTPKFKNYLIKNTNPKTARIDDIARLDFLLAIYFSDAVKKICKHAGLPLKEIDLIGSHGHTIQHLPIKHKLFGKQVNATLQIGNPSAIAKLTGIITIGDFRVGDIASGGTGAPLVPIFDFLLFRSTKFNRALLNIGGIANITVLPKNCSLQDVFAFDTGPGNMVIDGLTKILFNRKFDDKGKIAQSGKIISPLLKKLIQHPYFYRRPPKSTGREMFGESFIHFVLENSRGEKNENIITTVTELTALSIYINYLKHISPSVKIDEIIISGGGVHNQYIVESLKRYFYPTTVRPIEDLNISSDAKEAICFAVLANETISGNPANIPKATGAKKQAILGTICLP